MSDTGLRARKKRDTHRALADAGQELVRERGLDQVTVEDIAAAANVSVRTFFNYFACKEESIVGVDEEVLAELAEEILERPEDERPIDVLRAVLVDAAGDSMLRRWQVRNELVARYPALLPRHLAATVQVEEALARAFAQRGGRDRAVDPRPAIFVAAALAALRAGLAWWEQSDQATPLPAVIDAAFGSVADLPRSP